MNTSKNPRGAGTKNPAENMKAQANQASQEFKSKGKEQFEKQESQAADKMEQIADATGAAAHELARKDEPTLSHYMSEIADGISSLSNNLRHKNTDQLIDEASRLARQNTGLFLLGSVAIGFGLSRIAKAARHAGDSETEWEDYYGQQESASYGSEASSQPAANPSHASTSYLPEEGASVQSPLNPPNAGTSYGENSGPGTTGSRQ